MASPTLSESGFKKLLAELDDETVRQMLLHVSANNADAMALVLTVVQRRGRPNSGRPSSAGTRPSSAGINTAVTPAGSDEGAGPAVARRPPGGRIWRSFSTEELVSKSFMTMMDTGEFEFAASSTPKGSVVKKHATLPRTGKISIPDDLTASDRRGSADSRSDSGSGRRESTGKWRWFGGKKSKSSTSPKSKRKSKSVA